MKLWEYVRKYTYSSPERQIDNLIAGVKKYRKIQAKDKILDVGGGYKDRAGILRDLGKVIVLDVKPGKNVDVVGDAHALPFKDNSFDYVVMFMVLEHLHDPIKAFSECSRVLKKNGILLLTTVQYWHNHDCPDDYYRFTDGGLRYLCERSHLKIISIKSMGGPFLVFFHVIELNLSGMLRKIILLLSPLFNYLDKVFFNHEDKRILSDSVGWSLMAQKI